MYGALKPRKHQEGTVGKFAGIVSSQNLEFVQQLSKTYPMLTETGFCNKILNDRLTELRKFHEYFTSMVEPFSKQHDDISGTINQQKGINNEDQH